MNKILILGIAILVLTIIFFIIILIISKNKINQSIIPIDMSKDKINHYLKQKYKLYKQITNFIKNNLSIKEDAFQEFLEFNSKECTQSDLIKLLDKTTYEINEYVDNYDELLKNQEFLKLKRELYDIEINLEATSEYYNNKIIIYNNLKHSAPTKLCTIFFQFEEYNPIEINKKEIARLIHLN